MVMFHAIIFFTDKMWDPSLEDLLLKSGFTFQRMANAGCLHGQGTTVVFLKMDKGHFHFFFSPCRALVISERSHRRIQDDD